MIKSQILSNVIKIRKYLEQKGEASVDEIRNYLQLQEREVCLALGWMLCENRIYLRQDDHELFVIDFGHPHHPGFVH
ncbi:MAG: winged helix-turn-helix domain-containing protein [Mangrovibacterium sp.]